MGGGRAWFSRHGVSRRPAAWGDGCRRTDRTRRRRAPALPRSTVDGDRWPSSRSRSWGKASRGSLPSRTGGTEQPDPHSPRHKATTVRASGSVIPALHGVRWRGRADEPRATASRRNGTRPPGTYNARGKWSPCVGAPFGYGRRQRSHCQARRSRFNACSGGRNTAFQRRARATRTVFRQPRTVCAAARHCSSEGTALRDPPDHGKDGLGHDSERRSGGGEGDPPRGPPASLATTCASLRHERLQCHRGVR